MRKTQPIIEEEARPTKPSAWRYYVWQIAMWLTILHTALLCPLMGFVAWHWGLPEFSFDSTRPFIVKLAKAMSYPPVLPILVEFLLVPIVVIACYRVSMGKRAMGWLLGYWLPAGTIWVLLLSSFGVLGEDNYSYWSLYFHLGGFRPLKWLAEGLLMCVICLTPLPITMLAAFWTFGRKKRPPAMEAGA